jgi:hypothetical protein
MHIIQRRGLLVALIDLASATLAVMLLAAAQLFALAADSTDVALETMLNILHVSR